jgi:lathosterol oxidase
MLMDYLRALRPEQLYPTLTLALVVAAVDLGERLRPGFTVDRRRELPINLAALALAVFAGEWCKAAATGGLRLLGAGGLPATPLAALPTALKLPLTVLVTDFALYWVHRAMHNPRLLWFTHTFHHSIGEVWWLSGSRTSLTHLFLFAVPQMFIAHYLMRLNAMELAAAVSFGVAVNIWIHGNIWVNLGPLEKVFITPNFHRIHHGAKGLSNRNLGFVLTVWDRLFGTYTATETTGRDFALFPVPSRGRLARMMIGL